MTTVLLSSLRVKPPQGSPVVWTSCRGDLRHGLLVDASLEAVLRTGPFTRLVELGDSERASLALDLSVPPAGRLDGAHIAAGMLATSRGMDFTWGVTWRAWDCLDGTYKVTVEREGHRETFAAQPAQPSLRGVLASTLMFELGVFRERDLTAAPAFEPSTAAMEAVT